jgi:hypothetical protein
MPTLARHEAHLLAVGNARAQMSESIAHAFPTNDPERGDGIFLD